MFDCDEDLKRIISRINTSGRHQTEAKIKQLLRSVKRKIIKPKLVIEKEMKEIEPI